MADHTGAALDHFTPHLPFLQPTFKAIRKLVTIVPEVIPHGRCDDDSLVRVLAENRLEKTSPFPLGAADPVGCNGMQENEAVEEQLLLFVAVLRQICGDDLEDLNVRSLIVIEPRRVDEEYGTAVKFEPDSLRLLCAYLLSAHCTCLPTILQTIHSSKREHWGSLT